MIPFLRFYQHDLCLNGKHMSNPQEDLRKIKGVLASLDDYLKGNQDIHQRLSTLMEFFHSTNCKALDCVIQLASFDGKAIL